MDDLSENHGFEIKDAIFISGGNFVTESDCNGYSTGDIITGQENTSIGIEVYENRLVKLLIMDEDYEVIHVENLN